MRLPWGRRDHSATLLPANKNNSLKVDQVVVAGGSDGNNSLKSSEILKSSDLLDLTDPPVIKSFIPRSGKPGAVIIIKGKKISSNKKKIIVKLGGEKTKVLSVNRNGTKLKVKIPKKAVTGYITVTVGEETATSNTRFVIK